MGPGEHLDWFDDNVAWFNALDDGSLAAPVPNCPGWDVGYVLAHLGVGLGLAYPYALAQPPDTPNDLGFATVPFPDPFPAGVAARDYFAREMAACRKSFRSTDPALPCWTYAGAGKASFWFLRAAVETSLHRLDVEDALSHDHASLTDDRVWAVVSDCVDFVLPLAAALTGSTPGALAIVVDDDIGPRQLLVGAGKPVATITGSGASLVAALWGRTVAPPPAVSGDAAAAKTWLSLVEQAFTGR
jgi:uncharacterized protein (TIGR03083 family)